MLLMPLNLAKMADLADKNASGARWMTNAVYISEEPFPIVSTVAVLDEEPAGGPTTGDEPSAEAPTDSEEPAPKKKSKKRKKVEQVETVPGYVMAATDTKVLGVLTGRQQLDDESPLIKTLKDSPNGSTSGLVPAAFLRDAVGQAQKLTSKTRRTALQRLGVQFSENMVTTAATDLERTPVNASLLIEGRFPPYDSIMPKANAKPITSFAVDPAHFCRLLQTAGSFSDDGCVVVDVFDPEKPIQVRTLGENASQQRFAGICMPLSLKQEDEDEDDGEDIPEATLLTDEADVLRARLRAAESKLLEQQGAIELYRLKNEELKAEVRRLGRKK